MEAIVFKSQQGNPVTTSKLVAAKFGRDHKNVLQTIDQILADSQLPDNEQSLTSQPLQNKLREYFYEYQEETKVGNGGSKMSRVFLMSRKGFDLVVMQFKGKKALQFKIEFIEAFDAMQKEIQRLQAQQPQQFTVPQNFREALLLAAKQQELIEEQQKKIDTDRPKVEFYDNVLHSDSTFTTTQIAKELGMSAAALNKKLNEMHVQYKQNGSWVPYAKYQGDGLTKSETIMISQKDGRKIAILSFKWTMKGREFIHNKLKAVEPKAVEIEAI